MSEIYKYPLLLCEVQTIKLPINAKILVPAQLQHGEVCIWARVGTSLPRKETIVRIYRTGVEIDSSLNLKYCGTTRKYVECVEMTFHIFIEQ